MLSVVVLFLLLLCLLDVPMDLTIDIFLHVLPNCQQRLPYHTHYLLLHTQAKLHLDWQDRLTMKRGGRAVPYYFRAIKIFNFKAYL